jgi:CheY-like chemotaxis protein
VQLATAEKPDVVLMDIRMPGTDGIEATRQITAAPETAATRILVLTTFDLDEYVFAALRAGASGPPRTRPRRAYRWPIRAREAIFAGQNLKRAKSVCVPWRVRDRVTRWIEARVRGDRRRRCEGFRR